MPYGYQKDYLSVTECRIYLKPGCNLKKNLLSRYLSKNVSVWTLGGPFNHGSSKISLTGSILGSIYDHKGPGWSLEHQKSTKRLFNNVQRVQRVYLVEKVKTALKNLANHNDFLEDPGGFNESPWLLMDPVGINFGVTL